MRVSVSAQMSDRCVEYICVCICVCMRVFSCVCVGREGKRERKCVCERQISETSRPCNSSFSQHANTETRTPNSAGTTAGHETRTTGVRVQEPSGRSSLQVQGLGFKQKAGFRPEL
jgi:hypothetical protein